MTKLPTKLLRYVLLTPVALVGVWLALSLVLLQLSPGMIFKTERSMHVYPLSNDYSVELYRLDDGTTIESLYSDDPSAQNVVLYIHGNSGRVPHILDRIRSEGFDYYSPAHPGFHFSEGKPNTENIYQTGEKAYQNLLEKGYRENQIIIYGHSLGGPAAVHLAHVKPNAKALILVNAVSSVRQMCMRNYGIFCVFGGSILNGIEEGKKLNPETPVYQYHYPEDPVVPYQEGKKLYEALNARNKSFVDLNNQTHSDFDVAVTLSQVR